METTSAEPAKKSFKWSVLILIVSSIFVLSMCGLTIGALYLDAAGERAVGTLENVADCQEARRNCFTAEVTFTTETGEEVTFSPLLQTSFIYDIAAGIKQGGDSTKSLKSIDVRYLKANPKIAKISLALYLDYANKINFLFWGGAVALFSWIASRDKPAFVLDFRKRKK